MERTRKLPEKRKKLICAVHSSKKERMQRVERNMYEKTMKKGEEKKYEKRFYQIKRISKRSARKNLI